MDHGGKEFNFGRVCDLQLPVSYRIARLQGPIPKKTFSEIQANPELRHSGSGSSSSGLSDLYVTSQLYSNGHPISLPFRTRHKAFPKSYTWNEWISLPNKFSSIPPDAQLTFTVWDVVGAGKAVPIGGATLKLFDNGYLQRGEQRLYMHRNVKADGSVESRTPSDVRLDDELGRLEELMQKYEKRDMPHCDWLDRLTFREIEKLHAAESARSPHLFLYIDMLKFDFPIVFAEPEKPYPSSSTSRQPTTATQPVNAMGNLSSTPLSNDPHLWTILDPEMGRENLVEAKHRRLVRSHRTGPLDRELKPDARQRDELNAILRYPPTQLLLPEEKDLLWKFRFYLSHNKKALTKFLKSVSWSDANEVKQAVEVLLPIWTAIDMDDALELLGPGFVDGRVRGYAVRQLRRADDEELLLYLLQLVQALRFDNTQPSDSRSTRSSHSASNAANNPNAVVATLSAEDSGLADLLIERSVTSPLLGNKFYWYLIVECEDRMAGKMYAKIAFRYMTEMMKTDQGASRRDILRRQGELVATLSHRAKEYKASKDRREKKITNLRSFLGDPKNALSTMPVPLPLPLDGRFITSGISPEKCSIFKSNLLPLLLWFDEASPPSPPTPIRRTSASSATSTTNGGLPPRSNPVPSSCTPSSTSQPPTQPLPTSSQTPLPCPSQPKRPTQYPLIFKSGDDLRQDQLVLQLFTLMDKLLLRENLDLKLTTYSVLATGAEEGMIQFVPSKTLAGVMSEYGSLLGYMREGYPAGAGGGGMEGPTYGVKASVLDTFVRSCAGYCVLTYLLGVGDRHLDNLMLAPDGHFFHVDFGYILGRDPKPFPPPVKLSREMIDAMGGPFSPHYARFKSLCHTAFANLRKNANLILNLVALMVSSGVQDIRLEPDKAVGKIQDNFMLHLSEEDAIKQFEALLNQTSVLTAVFDAIHDWAQYFRN